MRGPRLSVRLSLGLRTLRRTAVLLPLLLLAAGTAQLFRAGQLQGELAREQGEPCELTGTVSSAAGGNQGEAAGGASGLELGAEDGDASSSESGAEGGAAGGPGSLSGGTLQAVQALPGVEAASLLWQLSGNLVYGDYQAQVSLWGMDGACLSGTWLQGGVYPESSAMAYLVLNRAALDAFRNERQIPLEAPEAVDWLRAEVEFSGGAAPSGAGTAGESASLSGGIYSEAALSGTPVRVCGVLEDGLEEPRAYLSGEQARSLQGAQGGAESPQTLWLRLTDAGARGPVVRELAALGISAEGEDAREADWDAREERRNLYLGAGAAILLCGFLVFGYQERLERRRETSAYHALEQQGLPQWRLRTVARTRWILLVAAGGALGAAAAWLVYF